MHLLWRIAAAAAARIAAVQYRLAPEHPFPAALDDALASWRGLLEAGADPRRAVFMGDSAGGGLVLALALRARDKGENLPAAIVAMSPWTDLAVTGASVRRNARADPMMNADDVPHLASRYLDGADPRHPYASPLYGDPSGLPPTLIQVGGDEVLLDELGAHGGAAARGRRRGAARNLAAHAARLPVVFLDPAGSPPRDRPYRRLHPAARRALRRRPSE